MTGIDRLRELADEYEEHSWSEAGRERGRLIRGIADRIEHDLKDERDRWDEELCEAQMDKTRVMAVYLEMNKHVLGHEGAEDSPVARWARELRAALGSLHGFQKSRKVANLLTPHSDSSDETTSAYDLLPQEDRDAIAWVREHGGLEKIIQQRRDSVPRADYERKLDKRLRHIAECEEALRRRNVTISSLEKAADLLRRQIAEMRPRLMPEGMEWLVEAWPRFEDDAPVRFLDDFERYGDENGVSAVTMYSDGSFALNCRAYSKGEHVKLPAPKVLDADGAEIHVGDKCYVSSNGDGPYVVDYIRESDGAIDMYWHENKNESLHIRPDLITHRAPVLAADGKPLREGEMVFDKDTGDRFEVDGFSEDGFVVCWDLDKCEADIEIKPSQLTHKRPVSDTWERLEEDAGCTATKYNERRGTIFTTKQQVARDLVRRAKKLAGEA